MSRPVRRPGVREGYNIWAPTYDTAKNPLVVLDRRHTLRVLSPKPEELILDAGCGTGFYMANILDAGARYVGADLSRGMLAMIRNARPHAALVESDLDSGLPFRSSSFDAVLSALVSEHIAHIRRFCDEVTRVLRPGGRFIWSVFHPDLAHGGTEANFVNADGYEVRLGAELHTIEDYRNALTGAGLSVRSWKEVVGDSDLARIIPRAEKYVGKPMLIVIHTTKEG